MCIRKGFGELEWSNMKRKSLHFVIKDSFWWLGNLLKLIHLSFSIIKNKAALNEIFLFNENESSLLNIYVGDYKSISLPFLSEFLLNPLPLPSV